MRPKTHRNGATLRSFGIGDDLASARANLARCIEQACDVIKIVVKNPPDEPNRSSEIAEFILPSNKEFSLLEEAKFVLRSRLDRLKAMVFNGPDSIKLAVSGNRLNKVSRRLCEAAEHFAALSEPIDELSGNLASRFPGYQNATYEKAATALLILDEWDQASALNSGRSHSFEMTLDVLRSLARDGKLRLVLFVCPPVEFAYLSSDSPERYLRTDMRGSVLSRLVDRLRSLFRGLEGAQLDVELLALICDTDEEDYIWHGVARPRNLDRSALDARREQLVKSVTTYLTAGKKNNSHPRVLPEKDVRVVRFSAIAPSQKVRDVYASVVAAPFRFFDQQDLDAEIAIMKKLWQPGSYYQGLDEPDAASITRIVIHKFATYAMQGVLMWECDPDLVLIQTERPPRLRAKMLNVGRKHLGLAPLTAVNFFETEEDYRQRSGYYPML